MVNVTIGSKEYQLDSLTSMDLKTLEAKKKEENLSDYDYAHAVILYSITKFNPDVKMSLNDFMGMFPIKNIDEKFNEIGEIIGLGFKMGIGKLETGEKI